MASTRSNNTPNKLFCSIPCRRQEVRNYFYDDEFFKCTVHLIDSGVDRDFVSALVGIVINLMSDKRHSALKFEKKVQFRNATPFASKATVNIL